MLWYCNWGVREYNAQNVNRTQSMHLDICFQIFFREIGVSSGQVERLVPCRARFDYGQQLTTFEGRIEGNNRQGTHLNTWNAYLILHFLSVPCYTSLPSSCESWRREDRGNGNSITLLKLRIQSSKTWNEMKAVPLFTFPGARIYFAERISYVKVRRKKNNGKSKLWYFHARTFSIAIRKK